MIFKAAASRRASLVSSGPDERGGQESAVMVATAFTRPILAEIDIDSDR